MTHIGEAKKCLKDVAFFQNIVKVSETAKLPFKHILAYCLLHPFIFVTFQIEHPVFQSSVIWPQSPKGLYSNFTLMPEYLKQLGYRTHMIGKYANLLLCFRISFSQKSDSVQKTFSDGIWDFVTTLTYLQEEDLIVLKDSY